MSKEKQPHQTENVILQSDEMISDSYTYREEFYFQRMNKDYKWYVTYKNQIIAHGQYQNDLKEWVDVTYPIKRVGRTEYMPEIKAPSFLGTNGSII